MSSYTFVPIANAFVLRGAKIIFADSYSDNPNIDSYYKRKPLGSIGNLGTYSFHEPKNIISGEGGRLMMIDLLPEPKLFGKKEQIDPHFLEEK